MLAPVALGLRTLQALFSIVILGLAITLIKFQEYGSAPTTTKYSAFVGGFGIIAAIIGFVSLFISSIPDLVAIVVDGLWGILGLAGGIAWAVGLKGISCSDSSYESLRNMLLNALLNMGELANSKGVVYTYGVYQGTDDESKAAANLQANCAKGFADEIFQFLVFLLALGLVGVGYVRMRKGGSPSYV